MAPAEEVGSEVPKEAPKKKARARGKKSTDDPNDPTNKYYMEPELIWWYSQHLPNRWRGCRTWRQLCEAACDGTAVACLADGCTRSWTIDENHDQSSCLMSLWAHMDGKSEVEAEWATKWHATENMMKQFLACYKREQLVELERQKT